MSTENLHDRLLIIDTINDLFIHTDDRDWAVVRECFAPEVLFDMTSVAGGQPARLTPRQITDGWEAGLKDLKAIHHQAGNYQISSHGDTAEAFCYGTAWHYLPNPSGRNTRTFVGSYHFHLIRTGERWVIDHMKFSLKFIDGNAELK